MSERGPSLTHIALQARDLEATIAFYRDYCGLAIVHDRTDRTRVVWLAQEPDDELTAQAESAAEAIGLPLSRIDVGTGTLEAQLVAMAI